MFVYVFLHFSSSLFGIQITSTVSKYRVAILSEHLISCLNAFSQFKISANQLKNQFKNDSMWFFFFVVFFSVCDALQKSNVRAFNIHAHIKLSVDDKKIKTLLQCWMGTITSFTSENNTVVREIHISDVYAVLREYRIKYDGGLCKLFGVYWGVLRKQLLLYFQYSPTSVFSWNCRKCKTTGKS